VAYAAKLPSRRVPKPTERIKTDRCNEIKLDRFRWRNIAIEPGKVNFTQEADFKLNKTASAAWLGRDFSYNAWLERRRREAHSRSVFA
jgi:hypothetical protein